MLGSCQSLFGSTLRGLFVCGLFGCQIIKVQEFGINEVGDLADGKFHARDGLNQLVES